MAAPTSQVKIPQLQREPASLQPEKIDSRSARSLLNRIFKKKREALPTAQSIKAEHTQFLLDTPIGRDFSLITAAGVEFQVHSALLVGGSKTLQEGLFPGGVNTPTYFIVSMPGTCAADDDFLIRSACKPSNSANIRSVNPTPLAVYTSDYEFVPQPSTQLKQSNFKLYHATHIPDTNPPLPTTTALIGTRDYEFHLHMYALAEELDYPALKSVAHVKLVDTLIEQHKQTPTVVKEAIDSTFSPLDNAKRICKDEDGILQQVVVAAVIVHEARCWNMAQQAGFTESIAGSAYAGFRSAYDIAQEENKDLISYDQINRALMAERKWAGAHRQQAKIGIGGEDKSRFGASLWSPIQARAPRVVKSKIQRKLDIIKRKAELGIKEKSDRNVDLDMEID
ncbi:ww domain-containing protein [Stemphylium lycopersici]|nr:ww domain-containing protein [Stemphylium lycopersici]